MGFSLIPYFPFTHWSLVHVMCQMHVLLKSTSDALHISFYTIIEWEWICTFWHIIINSIFMCQFPYEYHNLCAVSIIERWIDRCKTLLHAFFYYNFSFSNCSLPTSLFCIICIIVLLLLWYYSLHLHCVCVCAVVHFLFLCCANVFCWFFPVVLIFSLSLLFHLHLTYSLLLYN